MDLQLQIPSSAVLFSLLFFTLMLLKSLKKRRNLNLPPGPKQLPIIGNLHQLAGSLPHHRLYELSKKYGPIMHLRLGELEHIVISSSEGAKEILKTHDFNFAQRPFLLAADVILYNSTDIAFAPYGDYWRQLRKICTLELLSAKRVQSFKWLREEEISDAFKYISSNEGTVINLSKVIRSLIYTITARASFGEKCKDHDDFIPLAKQAIDSAGGFTVADLYPSFKILRRAGGLLAKLQSLRDKIDKVTERIINSHKVRRAAEDAKTGEKSTNLLDVLLDIQEQEDLQFPLESDNLKAVILITSVATNLCIALGGSDTSTTTVEWTMSELMRNPRVMTKTQEEVREVFGDVGFVDESCLSELHYLKLVIKETLRLHPPLPMLIAREGIEECMVSGYQIPKKYKVIVNAWGIGRDPKYWNQAETFFPERFLDGNYDYKGNSFEYLPFGAGRRICPGMTFGLANVEALLANLLYHFDWELAGMKPEDLDMDERFGSVVRRKNSLNLIPTQYRR